MESVVRDRRERKQIETIQCSGEELKYGAIITEAKAFPHNNEGAGIVGGRWMQVLKATTTTSKKHVEFKKLLNVRMSSARK